MSSDRYPTTASGSGPYRTFWRRLLPSRRVVTRHDDWMKGPLFTVNTVTGESRREPSCALCAHAMGLHGPRGCGVCNCGVAP